MMTSTSTEARDRSGWMDRGIVVLHMSGVVTTLPCVGVYQYEHYFLLPINIAMCHSFAVFLCAVEQCKCLHVPFAGLFA